MHYELNNTFYLPYAIQSLYRVILKTSTEFTAERVMLSFLKKAINSYNENEITELQQKLITQWKSMRNDPYQRDFFFYFPYCEWIESRINKQPFIEML